MTDRFKLLLVDDSPVNLTLLIDYLTLADFQLFVAESGASALDRLQYVQPDLILLDILMPGMSGFELCKLIKANPATCQIPVIFLTARDETADKLKGFAVGGVDYITKPLVEEEVLAHVHTHLRIAQVQQRLSSENARLMQQLTRQSSVTLDPLLNRTGAPASSPLCLSLFGHFQLSIHNQVRTEFRSDLVRALFAYIVLEGHQPLERTQLAEWFWPAYLPYTRLNSLRVAIHNLRQLLKPLDHLLVADRKTISFPAEPTLVWCDALLLEHGNPTLPTLPVRPPAINQTNSSSSFLLEFDHIESHHFQQWRQQKQAYYNALVQP